MQASSPAKKKPSVGATHFGRPGNVEDPDDDPEMYSNIDDQCVSYRPPDYRGFNPNSKAPPGDKTGACGEPIYGNSSDDYEDPGNTCTDNKMASESDEYYEVVDFQQRVSPIKEVAVTLDTGPPTSGEPGACAPATRNESTKDRAASVTSSKKNKQRAAFLCSPRWLTTIILLLLVIITILLAAIVYLEMDIDECRSDPCRERGWCTDLVDGYRCTCLGDYTGDHCENDIEECDKTPCQNGANCSGTANGYGCDCLPGYTGAQCQTDIDECSSDPCQGRAWCSNLVNGYRCNCLEGYTGEHCETNLDECASSPCMNGGQCTDLHNSFICICGAGYTGTVCETGYRTKYSCDFEANICDFIQDTNDMFNWKRHSGSTSSSATGPSGAYGSSWYIYTEASGQTSGDTTRISTPALYGGLTWCVKYAYHMYGATVGSLRLYRESRSTNRTIQWDRSGNQGNQWFLETRSTNIATQGNKIGWEGVRGNEYTGDIAIDSLKVSLGACP